MASSYVHPLTRLHAPRAKFRPKFAIAARMPAATADDGLTTGRTRGVGTPTISPASQEPALPTTALVQEAVDTALDSIAHLERQARDAARRFRRMAVNEAQLELTQLVQSTQTLLKLADMTAAASEADLEQMCEARGFTALADTNTAVSALVREQFTQDWRALAAAIEGPYLVALRGWRLVFEALDPSTGPYGTAA